MLCWYLVLLSPQVSPYNTQVPCTPPSLHGDYCHFGSSIPNVLIVIPFINSHFYVSVLFYTLYLHYCVSLPFQPSHVFCLTFSRLLPRPTLSLYLGILSLCLGLSA
ncbi:hypothetical protein ACN38_g1715 [Penicillium nordicum]|uniref:Uncharacterized protein n=1 Tax=Penicillium nordicum TaxID=229535 RepID=A0A0N0RZT6_9EURO|nr:hypothetical protein ACN38_g1715 [Penicillium nordicum]